MLNDFKEELDLKMILKRISDGSDITEYMSKPIASKPLESLQVLRVQDVFDDTGDDPNLIRKLNLCLGNSEEKGDGWLKTVKEEIIRDLISRKILKFNQKSKKLIAVDGSNTPKQVVLDIKKFQTSNRVDVYVRLLR